MKLVLAYIILTITAIMLLLFIVINYIKQTINYNSERENNRER